MAGPKLARRHLILLGLAAMFALGGVSAAFVQREAPLDRDALARLISESAFEPSTTGSIP